MHVTSIFANNYMQPVDIHIIRSPDENVVWFKQCELSLANQPVNIHYTTFVKDDIRQARHEGFLLGNSPYVSFVDADDMVMPGTFARCLQVLDQHPEACGVYTTCKVIDDRGNTIHPILHPPGAWSVDTMKRHVSYVHQVVVMRREQVLQIYNGVYDDIPPTTMEMYFLYCALTKFGPWVNVPHLGYAWRWHKDNAHRKAIQSNGTLVNNYRNRCQTLLLT